MRLTQAAKAAAGQSSAEPVPDTSALDALHESVPKLTVAQLQEELGKRGLDTKWTPLKGKKELTARLSVRPSALIPFGSDQH